MSKRLFNLTIFLTLLWVIAGLHSFAQLPVREEPRHHRVLENKYLRILDVRIPPGDTTLDHLHETPSVIVAITSTALGTQIKGQPPAIGRTEAGSMNYAPFDKEPIFHKVWNQDTGLFHVMDIELLGKPRNERTAPFQEPGFVNSWQEKLVNAYRVPLNPGQKVGKSETKNPLLLICIRGSGELKFKNNQHPLELEPGKFAWIASKKAFELMNHSHAGSGFVLLELL